MHIIKFSGNVPFHEKSKKPKIPKTIRLVPKGMHQKFTTLQANIKSANHSFELARIELLSETRKKKPVAERIVYLASFALEKHLWLRAERIEFLTFLKSNPDLFTSRREWEKIAAAIAKEEAGIEEDGKKCDEWFNRESLMPKNQFPIFQNLTISLNSLNLSSISCIEILHNFSVPIPSALKEATTDP